MALAKLIIRPPTLCLAGRCRFQTISISLLRPHVDRAYSKVIRGLSASVTASQNTAGFSVTIGCRFFSRLLGGRTINIFQTKRGLHRTLIAQAKGKSPFEVDGNVRRDTLIFSYKNDNFFRMITIFGIAQFFLWIYMAFVTDMVLKNYNADKIDRQKATFSQSVIILLKDYSVKISGACILLGNIVLFFTVLYPKRSVRSLTLLRGGENLKVTTYSYFGNTMDFTVPLEKISCMQSRNSKGATLAMKIKGHWWYYMLDKTKGTFHQPQLFDYVIGLHRELK